MTQVKHVSCGCCTNGCCCSIHMDIPRGLQPRMCDYCKGLARAPLDPTWRFDPALQEYVRKPQGVSRS